MKKLNYFIFAFLMLGFANMVNAQGGQSSVGKFMRSEERAYVVIAVILAIFLGIIFYLVRLERKINKLEKEK